MSHIVTAKQKILYVITKSNWGGAQRYVFDLATHLPKERFEVAVAMGGDGLLKQRLNQHGIRTFEIRNFMRDISLIRDIRAFFELIRLFWRERPDVVHLNSGKAVTIGALAARVARVPRIISTIHGWASNEPRPLWQQSLIRVAEYVGLMLAHETIVVCEHDRRPGTTVIHNGIESPAFLSREEARRTLGLPADAFVVGTIAELNKNKNIGIFIDAYAEAQLPHAVLAIIGDGEERASLETQVKKHPACDIRFLGFVVAAIGGVCLKAFDVFVLPSKKEGLPYVLLEAGFAERAVIATNVGGVSEIIIDNVTGTLVKAGSPATLESALERYVTDQTLYEKHGTALRDHVCTSFTLTRMVDQTIAHY